MGRRMPFVLTSILLAALWLLYQAREVAHTASFAHIKSNANWPTAENQSTRKTNHATSPLISTTSAPQREIPISVTKLEAILLQECKGRKTEHSDLRIKVDGRDWAMSFDEYKRWQADDFIRRNANPGVKSKNPPKLRTFTDAERPDPKSILRNWQESINIASIADDVKKERLARLKLGDDDVLKMPEVQEEIFNSLYKVPNLIHYVWFGCRRLTVDYYMSMLGALKFQKPRLILIHGDCLPTGEYWDLLKMQGRATIRFVKRTTPTKIWGNPVKVIQHQSDVARMQIMLEVGGMYLDTDSVVLRNVDDLRNYSMVLGEENYNLMSNAHIIGNRESWFLQRWYHEYSWHRTSMMVPMALWRIFPEKVHVVKELICRPNGQELKYIYNELYDWHNNYMMHFYSRRQMRLEHTDESTLKELAILNTTYGQVARHILWGDERARDITDWVVSCNETHGLVA